MTVRRGVVQRERGLPAETAPRTGRFQPPTKALGKRLSVLSPNPLRVCPANDRTQIRGMMPHPLGTVLRVIAITLTLACATLGAAEAPLSTFDRVTIEPTKTSIYIGTVSMTMPPYVRKNGTYESSYAAKVFPYFFSNEKGTLAITLADESLRKLERGEPVEFSGRAVNTDGEERRIEGKATPDGTAGGLRGKIKVRVFVSKRIELIFNTSYRFGEL